MLKRPQLFSPRTYQFCYLKIYIDILSSSNDDVEVCVSLLPVARTLEVNFASANIYIDIIAILILINKKR
jgi:hypothetical protein